MTSQPMKNFFIGFIVLFVCITRFYNLSWGAPYFFHPDERNIASSISQLQFPNQMNPHFFAYGSFPIYVIYFAGKIMDITSRGVSFEQAIIISRFFSALFSCLIVYLLYKIGNNIKNETTGIFAGILGATSIGFIQFAHFGTFELWTTFFGLFLVYKLICFSKTHIANHSYWIGLLLGILVAIKISNLVFFFLPLILLFGLPKKKIFSSLILWYGIGSIIFILLSPFVILDFSSFLSGISYESSVALGSLPVFYTQNFFDTIPILFQVTHVYPFLLSIPILFLFLLYLLPFTTQAIKHKNVPHILLIFAFSLLFFSQAFLFAKWVRYMVPTLPFIYLLIAISTDSFKPKYSYWLKMSIVLFMILYSFSFFLFVYTNEDTRLQAFSESKKLLPVNTPILSEQYDLGIIPFNQQYANITLFNPYELENSFDSNNILKTNIRTYNAIILPSERVLNSRINNPKRFPVGNYFYTQLLNENLGYKKVFQTPCNFFCKVFYNFGYVEQTAYIFDRPVFYIYKHD